MPFFFSIIGLRSTFYKRLKNFTKYMKIQYVILALTLSPHFWVWQVTIKKLLNRSDVILKTLRFSFPVGRWTGMLMVLPLNWTINMLKPQLTKRREKGMREVTVANQTSWWEAFRQMKQYSASAICFWWFMFFMWSLKGYEILNIYSSNPLFAM